MAEISDRTSLGWRIAAAAVGLGVAGVAVYVWLSAPREQGHVGEAARLYRVPAEGAPTKGPADALVTIVEFSDFQCPHCRAASRTLSALIEAESDLRLVFRQAPLTRMHPQALPAAVAALAADRQGKFWEYHDALFEHQQQVASGGDTIFDELARQVGLDIERFDRDRRDRSLRGRVRADRRLLLRLGQGAVPTLFINGRVVRGNVPLNRLREVVREARTRAQAALSRGVSRQELYRFLVSGGFGPELPEPNASRPER